MRITLDGDEWERIDRLAERLYGTEQGGRVEALLAANPGLGALAARHAGFLPRGTQVSVPAPPKPAPNPAFIRPWQ